MKTDSFAKINKIYSSRQGIKLAIDELLPVANKYIENKNPKILEVGCGPGRNLIALSYVSDSQVTVCDISAQELKKAKKMAEKYCLSNVTTVWQPKPDHLPFKDKNFDFVVIWQVLEHILSKEGKQKLINEITRVLKNQGHFLIETPNFLFPFDYHDNNLPFVHWFLPNQWRRRLTKIVRRQDFPPSEYTTIYQIKKFLKQSPHIKSFEQKTKIYFEKNYSDIFRHLGGTRLEAKLIFFLLYAPVYYFLRLLRLPGDTFTPSLRLVFQIKK